MNFEKKTYTIFQTDLRPGADRESPGLADIRTLNKDQILEAWSILYIRPNGNRFYLKNRDPQNQKPSALKKKTRFQILKEQL